MQRFIKNILVFSSVLVALIAFLEITLRRVPNSYTFKRQLIEQNTQQVKQLIIGSSVSNCGLDPAYLEDSTLNLSISGQWIRYNQAILEKYIDQLPHLQEVIWGITYHTLWLDDCEEVDKGSMVYHQIYWDLAPSWKFLHQFELLSTAAVGTKKWSKYYLEKRNTMHCDSLGLDNGFELKDKSAHWEEHLLRKVKEHTVQTGQPAMKKRYHDNLERIKQVADLCHTKGITLHLVICPVYELYYTHTDSTQVKLMKEGLEAVTQQKANVHLYDYFHDARFIADDFFDGNHLSTKAGSTKLSKILHEDLKRNKR